MRRTTQLLYRRASSLKKSTSELTVGDAGVPKETIARHRNFMNINDLRPLRCMGTFIAPNASICGRVRLMNNSSVWYGAVVRGDKARVHIGHSTQIQDKVVINTVSSLETGFSPDVDIKDRVTIGSGAILTSCVVGSSSYIGAGAIIQEGTEIGEGCVVAPGSVVAPGTLIKDLEMWEGNPAKFVRKTGKTEVDLIDSLCDWQHTLAEEHEGEFLPYGIVYQEAEKL